MFSCCCPCHVFCCVYGLVYMSFGAVVPAIQVAVTASVCSTGRRSWSGALYHGLCGLVPFRAAVPILLSVGWLPQVLLPRRPSGCGALHVDVAMWSVFISGQRYPWRMLWLPQVPVPQSFWLWSGVLIFVSVCMCSRIMLLHCCVFVSAVKTSRSVFVLFSDLEVYVCAYLCVRLVCIALFFGRQIQRLDDVILVSHFLPLGCIDGGVRGLMRLPSF